MTEQKASDSRRLARLEKILLALDARVVDLDERLAAATARVAVLERERVKPTPEPRRAPPDVAAIAAPAPTPPPNDPNSAFRPDGSSKSAAELLRDAQDPERFTYRGGAGRTDA